MNTSAHIWNRSLVAVAVTAALAVGCASAPKKPAGSEQVRATMAKLVGLPPPPKKTVEPVVDEGGANVPEAPAEGAPPAAEEGKEGEPGAEAHAAPTPTTT